MTTIKCKHCGSEDVYRTVVSYWSKDQGAWVDDPWSEELGCVECGGNEMEIWEDVEEVQ